MQPCAITLRAPVASLRRCSHRIARVPSPRCSSMPVDLRGVLHGALDVTTPPFAFERVRERAAARLRTRERRRTRSMLSAAALVALIALFAGGYAPGVSYAAAIAALPIPAPAPQTT